MKIEDLIVAKKILDESEIPFVDRFVYYDGKLYFIDKNGDVMEKPE